MTDPLHQFLEETRDTREYRRAVAVQMARQGIDYDTITAVLSVSKAFISKWTGISAEQGVEGLCMGYHGSVGYLTATQRDQTIAWLRDQVSWSVPALQAYLQDTFQVVYQSLQSSYDLLHAAGLSWKKTQATNPKKNDPVIAERCAEPPPSPPIPPRSCCLMKGWSTSASCSISPASSTRP